MKKKTTQKENTSITCRINKKQHTSKIIHNLVFDRYSTKSETIKVSQEEKMKKFAQKLGISVRTVYHYLYFGCQTLKRLREMAVLFKLSDREELMLYRIAARE